METVLLSSVHICTENTLHIAARWADPTLNRGPKSKACFLDVAYRKYVSFGKHTQFGRTVPETGACFPAVAPRKHVITRWADATWREESEQGACFPPSLPRKHVAFRYWTLSWITEPEVLGKHINTWERTSHRMTEMLKLTAFLLESPGKNVAPRWKVSTWKDITRDGNLLPCK